MDNSPRLLEEAYMSTGNSGIGIKIHRHVVNKSPQYTLTIHHGAFGHHSEFSTPLLSLEHVSVMTEILARTALRISQEAREGHRIENPPRGVFNEVREGIRYTGLYEEYVSSEYSTQTFHVGDQLHDATTGEHLEDRWFENLHETGRGSSGSQPQYTEDQIGCLVYFDHKSGKKELHPTKRLDMTRVIGLEKELLEQIHHGLGKTLVDQIVQQDARTDEYP